MFLTDNFGSEETIPPPLHEQLALGFEMTTLMSLDRPGMKPTRTVWVAYLRMATAPTLDVLTDPPKVDVPLDRPQVR